MLRRKIENKSYEINHEGIKGRRVAGLPARGDGIPKGTSAFALIEILIAITILSISLLGIITGVSGAIMAISGNKNLTKAMFIAKNKITEFEMNDMKEPDIRDEQVKEYSGFTYSREVKRFEHELFGPLSAKRIEITVKWQERGKDKSYVLSYIYPSK